MQSTKIEAQNLLDRIRSAVTIDESDRGLALGDDHMIELIRWGLKTRPRSVLEVGLGWGYSAAALQSLNSVKRHVIVEIGAGEDYLSQAEANIGRFVAADSDVKIIWKDSSLALPELCETGEQFDLVLIDGGHRFDDAFVDFHFARRLCAPGGIIILDDVWMPAVRSLTTFIDTNLAGVMTPLPCECHHSMAVYQKSGAQDLRAWDHFIPFSTQPI